MRPGARAAGLGEGVSGQGGYVSTGPHLGSMLGVGEERQGHLPGSAYGVMSKEIAMRNGHEATGTRQKGSVLLALLVALLVTSAVPGYAQRGGHGGGPGGPRFGPGGPRFGPGGPGFRPGGPGFRPGGPRFLGPRLGVSIWPYWDPYWAPYDTPPIVVAPPPQVYVEPALPTWYYCDNPPGYYPYVQQCPGGWRPVTPPP